MRFPFFLRYPVQPRPLSRKVRVPRKRLRLVVEELEGRLVPSTFFVTTAADTGPGSLRDAILQANKNPGPDVIQFYIGNGGAQTIRPASPLPKITDSVVLDGTTQPGFAGSPMIELDGTNAGSANGLWITAGNSTVKGLVINQFHLHGILLENGNDNVIQGNYLGTDRSASLARGNLFNGMFISGSSENTIGGALPGQGNIISANLSDGIGMDGGAGSAAANRVVGNYIGLDGTGLTALGNHAAAMRLMAVTDTVVGGTTPAERNVIAGNGGGISVSGARNLVLGNFIGVNALGLATVPSPFYAYDGVTIDGVGNQVFGNVIAGSTNGVDIAGIYTELNVVQGNLIGTDVTGTRTLGNGLAGVLIAAGARFNVVGGPTEDERNILSGNNNGVWISGNGTSFNSVEGNYIGTDLFGGHAVGNASAGVRILGAASDNNVRDNVISGNGYYVASSDAGGVVISGTGTSRNNVSQNKIGTDASGTHSLGNFNAGVRILGSASDNEISGNVISGNGNSNSTEPGGVVISGSGTNRNTVFGNYIGTDVTGTRPLGNFNAGVRISDSADSNTIGGWRPEDRNVISANGKVGSSEAGGVVISRARFTLVIGNYIGTDFFGTGRLSNIGDGVLINEAGNQGVWENLISGNSGNGVEIRGHEAQLVEVARNFIGTDWLGLAPLGNSRDGVYINDAPNNEIGHYYDVNANIISGNGQNGVEINGNGATGNVVDVNNIGTGVGGSFALPNLGNGVLVDGAPRNDIVDNNIAGNIGSGVEVCGSGAAGNDVRYNSIGLGRDNRPLGNHYGVVIRLGANQSFIDANVVSANRGWGILIIGAGSTGNMVEANLIGTDPSGTAPLGNSFSGVAIWQDASDNTIGGTTSNARNVISGNAGEGVEIVGATGNHVQGNFIGTDASGTQALGNRFSGVFIDDAPNETIGGTASGAGNVISGNFGAGVQIIGVGSTGILVQGNLIGTDVSGFANLGNTYYGVGFEGAASQNTVRRNRIAFNNFAGGSYAGVFVESGTGNAILSNSIASNGRLGIDLAPFGVTLNDSVGHTGPNHNQNFPDLTSVISHGDTTTFSGEFHSSPNSTFLIEFFAATPDPSGFGQGDVFLGSTTVTTNRSGELPEGFSVTLDVIIFGEFITATATNLATNDTSEFSHWVAEQAVPPPPGVPGPSGAPLVPIVGLPSSVAQPPIAPLFSLVVNVSQTAGAVAGLVASTGTGAEWLGHSLGPTPPTVWNRSVDSNKPDSLDAFFSALGDNEDLLAPAAGLNPSLVNGLALSS